MKKTRKLICLVLAVVLCMSFAVTAFAAITKSAGIYGTLTCRSYQSGTNVFGETYVTQNPDSAYLLVKFTIENNSGVQTDYSKKSTSGVTLFSYTVPFTYYTPESVPIYVYYCGEVRGGSQSPSAYVTTTGGYSIDRTKFN